MPLIGFKHLNHIRAGLFNVHATRVLNHSSIDAQSLSDAEVEGREQAWQVAEFLKRRVPGFENAFLVTSCTQIGVREGRRLTGAYVLTDEDVLNARKFDDVIACGCYNIDIHQPQGDRTVHIPVPEGDWYDIPYRCLYSAEVGGFLAAGRDISGTREAHGSYRGQSHCMAIGQAAGCAAALAARESCDVRTLDVELLQKTLRSQDAFLGE